MLTVGSRMPRSKRAIGRILSERIRPAPVCGAVGLWGGAAGEQEPSRWCPGIDAAAHHVPYLWKVLPFVQEQGSVWGRGQVGVSLHERPLVLVIEIPCLICSA